MTGWLGLPEVAARDLELAIPMLGLLPAPARVVLARCALVGLFDAEMYDEVLAADRDVALDQLVRFGVVAALPGGDGKYCVRTAVRAVAWREWLAGEHDDTALREFGERLAAYCERRGLGVQRLRALLLVDNDRAEAAFGAEFDACAERMDLAGCRNLLDVLADPMLRPFVNTRMITLRNERRRAVRAREVLRRTFLGSARYMHRPQHELMLEALLSQEGPRALRLRGSGGYGKSTLLNWFISRRCVPAGIPCALVDLDIVDPVNATRHPFLLVLEIAYQLNGQIDGAPFEELLREHGFYRPVLTRQASEADRAGSAALGTMQSEVDAEDVSYRFLSVLHDVTRETPVLIVLDTFEEAALRPAGDAYGLVQTMAALHDGDPAVRLVVSGRHTRAEDGISVLASRFPPDRMPVCEVAEFSTAETATYLAVTRGLARPDLVPAIVARAGGVPWQVALYADVVEQYPTITSEVLRTLDPGVAWTVDRVIARIEDDVQWLVRYGTVPRRLTRDFAEHVIMPRLQRSMAGSEDDRPERDPIPPDALPVFRTGSAPDDVGVLWDRLIRYTATNSWMWMAPNDKDAVVFHPAVRGPMRRLVAAQPVCELLHRDAVKYYEGLAVREHDSWPAWIGEVLYHRFQLDGTRAAPYWRAAIAEAWSAGRPDWVASVAGEILGPEYIDEEGTPLTLRPGESIVDVNLLAAAHAEQAWASATVAYGRKLPGGDVLWSQVETSLNAAGRLPSHDASAIRLTAARATLLVARGNPAEASELLASVALSEQFAPAERLAVSMVSAGALAAVSGPAAARQTLLGAWDIAERQALFRSKVDIAVSLAEEAEHRGRLDEAARWIRRVADLEPTWQSTRLGARIELELGRPETALTRAKTAVEQVEALTVLGRPADAVDLATRSLGVTSEPAQRAGVLVWRALARADLLDVDAALEDLLQARSIYFQIADTEGAGMTYAHVARVQLRAIGNLNDARHQLDEADRLLLRPGSPAWLRHRLLRVELSWRRGAQQAAAREAARLLDVLAGSTDPRPVVEAALIALVAVPTLQTRALALLEEHLPGIVPPAARLLALSTLDKCVVKPWGRRLASWVFPEGDAHDTPQRHEGSPADRAWFGLRVAELLRVAGRPSEAVELAAQSVDRLGEQSRFARWQLVDVAHRARIAARRDPAVWFDEVSDPEFALLTAAAALMIADLSGNPPETGRLLAAAEDALGMATARISRWHLLLFDLRRRLAASAEEARSWELRSIATLADLGEREQQAGSDLTPAGPREVRLDVSFDETGALVVVSDQVVLLRLSRQERLVVAVHEDRDRRAKSPLVRCVREALRDNLLLALPAKQPQLAGEQFDLRITAHPPLAQLPWELVTIGGRRATELPGVRVVYRCLEAARNDQVRTRVLQEALVEAGFDPGPLDGYLGTLTKRAVSLLQYQQGLEVDGVAGPATWQALRGNASSQPNVLVIRREFAHEAASGRGYSNVGGEDLARLYRQSGWTVHVAGGHDVRRLDDVLPAGVPVDVLHVNASVEVSGSVPYLDFGASLLGWSGERSEDVTVTDLDHAVYQLSLRGRTPLVVLDVTAPPQFSSETVRHLLLRNDLAHQLLMLGRAHTVLATGLGTEATAAGGQRELVEELAAGATPADVVRRLHLRSEDQRQRTALFTALRPDLMPRI